MEKQLITIPVTTDLDQAQLHDIAIELAEKLVEEIETYDSDATIDEGEVSVELADD